MPSHAEAGRRTPIRRGKTYCSPRCGMGCTWEAFQEAGRKAEALVALCAAEGLGEWRAEVWENLGWHYKVMDATGALKIHPRSGVEGYAAYAGAPGSAGGRWTGVGATPRAALAAIVERLQKEVDSVQATRRALEGALEGAPNSAEWGGLP